MSVVHSQEDEHRTLELLWGIRAPSTRGPRPRVTIDDIAAAGVRWADKRGVGSLTLAGVASELGLTATALYRYLDSKDALLELMVDHAIGTPPPLGGTGWRARVQDWTRGLSEHYRHHPWLAHAEIGGMPRYPSALAWIDLLLRELDQGPVSDPMRLALLLDGLARTFGFITGTPQSAPPRWLRTAIAEQHPRLASELDRDWTDIDDELTQAVNTVLTGAEHLHSVSPAPSPAARPTRPGPVDRPE